MRTYFRMLLACAAFLGGCTFPHVAPQTAEPAASAEPAEPRGIIGELCPPALAAKGYC